MSGHRVQFADLPPSDRKGSPQLHKQAKSNLKVTSPEDAEHLSRSRQAAPNGTPPPGGDPKASRTVPRRHTLGGARTAQDILAMQPPEMDKKREAFLEHLKQKYPHHASAIMGHQERLREQYLQGMLSSLHSELDIQRYLMRIQCSRRSRSPKHGPSSQPSLGDQDHLSLASVESLDTMSESDAPSNFTRGSRVRASLPVVRSTNQTKDRSLGVLYLQYGDETKQIRMPNEITSGDTVRALFVGAFPQQLNMKMLESPSVAVYVKDDMRNMYYELTDVRNITDHSCLKVYHKDPAQAFSHGPRPTNGDARMHREMMYSTRDVQHPLRQPPMGPPHHPMPGSMSPTTPHSMPPSPSRIPFGPRQGSMPGSATMPRERLPSSTPPARSVSPCPSAILERRDVKPDEDMGGKSHSLSRGAEALYADPFLIHEGRMVHGGPPPPLGPDGPEHGLAGYHRATIRSTGSYGGPSPTDTMEHPSLYRQRSKNSQLPTLGSKTPPPSPHRMTEVRMIDIHGGPPHGVPPHGMALERSSPVRQSFRKEEMAAKSRGSMPSPVVSDLQGHLQGSIPPANDPQTRERMKAMEQQIASLTGLVQHALLKGPDTGGTTEPPSERSVKTASPADSAHSTGGSPVLAPKSGVSSSEGGATPLQVNLLQFRRNVSDLRLQLQQMRQQQLQNQEGLRMQLKRAEQEISGRLADAMRRLDDPAQRQRSLVEEDRHKYLGLEEGVLAQLGELEQYVDTLKRDSAAGIQRGVTLKEVEEGAVNLRRVGESLAGLKGEFPALQTRMRSVLRVEVEAVKFLKEEPHKLDSMLKRVKSLTETLSGLRRCATDGLLKGSDPPISAPVWKAQTQNSSAPVPHAPSEPPKEAPAAPAQPGSASPSALPEPQASTIKSEVMPASPVVIHHVQSSPVHMQQSQQSAALVAQPSPPLTPSQTHPPSQNPGRISPKAAGSDPPSPAQHKKAPANPVQPPPVHNAGGPVGPGHVIEELQSGRVKNKDRAMCIEAAEKEWAERRQNMGHYDGKEFEKILQEAQVNMMKGIPSLEVGSEGESPTESPPAPGDQVDTPQPAKPPSEDLQPELSLEKTVKPGPEKPPKPAFEKPSKACAERPSATKPVPVSEKSSKVGTEKACKSPPPPPPRKTFTSSSGMTTTRSGEVVFTSRRESVTSQEEEEETTAAAPQPKPAKVPPETKPKPSTPPLVTASAVEEEEDEGDKIMAELQVFQKCTVKDVGVKSLVEPARIEPQIRELRPGPLLPLKDKKQSSDPTRDEKVPETDENGNTPVRQSPGVIYYVTGQIAKEQLSTPGLEDTPERREPTLSPSQVSNVNANDGPPSQQQPVTPPPISPPPISPKPVGLNGFKSPSNKQPKHTGAVKTGPFKGGNVVLNKKNTEKKFEYSVVRESLPSSKSTIPDTKVSSVPTTREDKGTRDQSRGRESSVEQDEGATLSADLPGEEAPPPPDNIAFMITNSKVQPLSCGEYQELVNNKGRSVQTVTVDNRRSTTGGAAGGPANPQDNGFNKKPVIIIFDEPMDIRSAYKRLSTVFECEEELERMLAEERIDEESEESDSEKSGGQVKVGGSAQADHGCSQVGGDTSSNSSTSSTSDPADRGMPSDGKQEGKKKFKFKFPKKQFAALTQAIRTGTKTGKKTLQVVVYEDEEESDGTVKQHKEAKRFEIVRSKSLTDHPKAPAKWANPDPQCRTNEIRKSTYKTLDSLEQTIKQLETTISEMGPMSSEEPVASGGAGQSKEAVGLKRSSSLPSSKVPKLPLASKSSLRKKGKPQLLPRPLVIPATATTSTIQQTASVASPASRMPVPLSAKSRQSPGTSDKAGKQQKLQDAQRQFRQANGSAKRAGGDHKTTSPTIPASKIPAFYPSSAKSSSQSAPNSDTTNPTNPSSASSSSTTKSSIPSPHTPRSSSAPSSSHIPSLSNGSLKLPTPSHTGKALSFSSQPQNGRAPSSSSSSSPSSPSPLSPTPLGPGGKSIRTIHTPSFTSYRPHNGSNGKSCIPTPTAAKESI
ncbi:sickle tail protein homolog [Aplochiton taeniatus]